MVTISTHPKMLDELFLEINNSSDPLKSMKDKLGLPYFKNYLELTVSDEWITLDIATVEFKQYDYHRSIAGSTLLNRQTWNIISNIFMKKDIPNKTKANQYKALSEMLYNEESRILTAILNKNLTSLYPNITFGLIFEVLQPL